MGSIEDLIGQAPALAKLAPEHRAALAACASEETYEPDALLLREGAEEPAFFVLRDGHVALEVFVPQRGAVAIQTLHDGDLLGWSWLIEPYRAAFDARALETTHVIRFDAARLREAMAGDPTLGADLLRAFAAVIVQRLQATRLQLLDVYAPPSP